MNRQVTCPKHIRELEASSLTAQTWEMAGLYTEDDPKLVAESLHWNYSAKKLGSCLAFPYIGLDGKPFEYTRFKPNVPRRDKDGKVIKYEAPRGQSPRAYFSPLVRERWSSTDPLTFTEGEKKALAGCQNGFAVIGLSGVWSWKTKDAPLLHELETIPWKDRRVFIAFDSDRTTNDNVRLAEAYFATALIERGALVRLVELSPGPENAKTGIDDFFVRGGTPAQFRELLEKAVNPRATRPKASGGRAAIVLGTDEHRVTAECITAMSADPGIYQRGGEWVRVGQDGDTGTPVVAIVGPADLRRRLTEVADLLDANKGSDGEIEFYKTHPPQWLIPQLVEHPEKPGIRRLIGLSSVPILRKDGSVRMEPGFDAETGMYFAAGGAKFPALPARIERHHVQASASALLNLIGDFPIPDAAGRSVYLSLILSVLARHLFDGGVPLHLIDANVRGSGKGLLVDVAGTITIGGCIPTQAYSHEQAEMRKVITAVVMAGKSMQHLDNLASGGMFGNAALDSALTSNTWSDRVLGENRQISLPHRTVWCASGNNVALRADTARRIIRMRMESPHSAPEDRDDFRCPDLLRHVRDNRPALVMAAITIVAGYLRAGKPYVKLPPAGSFVGWSGLVRSAIVWAGFPDPWATNLSAREEIDTEADELLSLIAAWEELDPDGAGLTTAAAKKRYQAAVSKGNRDSATENPFPRTAELLAGAGMKDFDASRIGYILRKHKNRLTSDGKIVTTIGEETKSKKPKGWIVKRHEPAVNGGDGGIGGHVFTANTSHTHEASQSQTRAESQTGEKHPPSSPHPPHGGAASDEVCQKQREWNEAQRASA